MTTHTQERPSSRRELAAWYEAVLAQQERSGLSVAAFADQVGVNAVTLYAWRRRLSGSAARRRSRRAAAGLVRVRVLSDEQPSEAAAATKAPLIVRIGRGRGIEVPPGFDAAELARLVGVLESC